MLKKKILLPLGFLLAAVFIFSFTLWQIHEKTKLPPLLNNEGYLLPRITFESNYSGLSISSSNTTQEASEIIFNQARYGRTWEYFHLPQINKQTLSLQPYYLVFELKHLNDYSQAAYGTLFDVAVDENNNPFSGFICNESDDLDTIYCQLFVGDWLLERSEDDIKFYLTNRIFRIILILGRQDLSRDQNQTTLEDLHRQLQEQNLTLLEVSLGKQLSIIEYFSFPQLLTLFQPQPVQAQLTEYCAGDVRCYLWVRQCRCPNGRTCEPGTYCSPEDGGGICPSCDPTCSSSYDTDGGAHCRSRSLDSCAGPVPGGTCEGLSPSTYCATGGTCFPSGGGGGGGTYPTATPVPTQAPCVFNCGDSLCCSSDGENSSNCPSDCGGGGTECWYCASAYECRYGDPGGAVCSCADCVFGSITALVFVDNNDNGIWDGDSIDSRVKSQEDGGRETGQPDVLIPNLEIRGNGNFGSNVRVGNVSNMTDNPCSDPCSRRYECVTTGSPFWRNMWDPQCNGWWSNSCYSRNRCCDNSNCWTSDRECTAGKFVTDGKEWLIDYRFTHKLVKVGNYTLELVNLGNEWEIINSQPYISAIHNGCDTNYAWFALKRSGSLNNSPMVTEISQIPSEDICQSDATTNTTFYSNYYDIDIPNINLIENGSFEEPLDGWVLHAADPDGTYNPGPHSFGTTTTEKYFHSQSVYVTKNAATEYGPQINHALPTLTVGQTYTFSVWAKSTGTSSARMIVQRAVDPYTNFSSVTHSGSGEWELLRTTFTPAADQTNAQIILSGGGAVGNTAYFDGLLIEEGNTPGIFSDIRAIEFNIEKQTGNNGIAYNASEWPIRLIFNRQTNQLRLIHSPSGREVSTGINFNSSTSRWSPANDITVTDGSNTVATLLAENTNFSLSNSGWSADWNLEIHQSLPLDQYFLTGKVTDWQDAQDQRPANLLHVTTSGGTVNHYFQRLGEINFISPPTLNFRFLNDPNITSSLVNFGEYCTHTGSLDELTLSSADIEINEDNFNTNIEISSSPTFSYTISQCYSDYLEATLRSRGANPSVFTDTSGNSYTCACPTSEGDGCHYSNVPTDGSVDPINFYLTDINLNNSAWFQAVGGQIISAAGIRSPIPWDGVEGPCLIGVSCIPALITNSPWGTGEANTPGFPLTDLGAIRVHATASTSDLIHYNDHRTQSVDAHATEADAFPKEYRYRYFFNRFGFQYQDNSLTNNSLPNLDSRDADLEGNLYVFYHNSNLQINDTNNWSVESNQKVIVFVDGNLTISDTGDGSKITSVGVGGYLAFIVNGDITIDSSVGTPTPTSTYPAFFASPLINVHAEGIFLADGEITIESNNNPNESDKKFIGAGTFVGWTGVSLERDFSDNNIGRAWHNYNPTETFIYRPDFLVNTPRTMKHFLHEWREVAPRLLE